MHKIYMIGILTACLTQFNLGTMSKGKGKSVAKEVREVLSNDCNADCCSACSFGLQRKKNIRIGIFYTHTKKKKLFKSSLFN